MNSETLSNETLVLRLETNHVPPSFKNSKMITRGKLITHPRKQKVMDAIIRDFESQLSCAIQMAESGTSMVDAQHCLIALSKVCDQFDDSVQWIPDIRIIGLHVKKGFEGATVSIEQI